MVINTSSIQEIEEAIHSYNPFDRPFFVKEEDIWNRISDVPSINSHASDAIFEAIEKVRKRQRETIGITVRAERGLGKSHLIARIRQSLWFDGSALFVYMSEYSNLDQIKREFLHTLALSLKRIGSEGVLQWQEVATALLSEVFKKNFQPQQMVETIFPSQIARNIAQGKKPIDLVNYLRDTIFSVKQDLEDPFLIQALLWTLSKPHAPFAINYLAGKSLTQSQAEAMGLPISTNEDEETDSLYLARRILNLIGNYKTVVICFDELDGVGVNQHGYTRPMVVASLAKDIANDFKRGVLLTAMYPQTWAEQIRAMPQAEAVIDRIAEKIIELKYLNSDSVIALVSQQLKEFYDRKGLTPPHPVYPFDEARLRKFGEEKPIIRQVLKWCSENISVVSPEQKVERAYRREFDDLERPRNDLERAIEGYLEEEEAISSALRLAFQSLITTKEEVEQVEVVDVQDVQARGTDRGYINFRIVGKEKKNKNRLTVKIGVAVVQQSGGASISAALKRLKDYEKFDLSRGCLVRSKEISPTAKQAYEHLRELLQKKGEWVLLLSEQLKPLLAIYFVYSRKESYELSEKEIFDFIHQQKLVINNPLIREILSAPTGKIPKNATAEDIVATMTVPSNLARTSNSDTFGVETNK